MTRYSGLQGILIVRGCAECYRRCTSVYDEGAFMNRLIVFLAVALSTGTAHASGLPFFPNTNVPGLHREAGCARHIRWEGQLAARAASQRLDARRGDTR